MEKLLPSGANLQFKTLDGLSALVMVETFECLRLLHNVEKKMLQLAD